MTESASEWTDVVARRLMARDMENETWEKGCAVNGLLSTEQDEFVDYAQRLIDRAVATQSEAGVLNYDDPQSYLSGDEPVRAQSEPSILGHGVLEFYDQTGDKMYLDAADAQYRYLMELAYRSEEGGISFGTSPIELWVGPMYMNCPFLSRYGQLTDTPEAIDEAVEQLEIHTKFLQDPHTGLFRHSWRETPNSFVDSSFWARGNGWAVTGLVETLRYLPADHPGRESIVSIFRELCSSIHARQAKSGMWHNILDSKVSKLEASGTLQFIYAFNLGRELGILKDESYDEAAEKAMNICKGLVDSEGNVRRVAVPPDKTAPLGVTSYGQGFFLLAATSMEK